MRTTDPKHSFEITIAMLFIGLAAIVCSVLGETRLWSMLFGVLWIMLGVQGLRVRQEIAKQRRRERAWRERMIPRMERAIAEYEQAMSVARKEPDDVETARLLAMLRDDVEEAQEREGAEV